METPREQTELAVTDSDSKRIIHEWDREIDDMLRRKAEQEAAKRGPWRILSWAALWMLWLVFLAVLVTHARTLG